MKTLKLFKSKNNKKGLMALDALVGIILSVIGLFFIINTLSSTFLVTPENQKIAEDNMQSIYNFINFAEAKYKGDYSGCYVSLKISNLENFQFTEDNFKKNYFYIIDKNYIYLLKLNDYEQIKKNFGEGNFDFSSKIVSKKELGVKVELLEDNTDEGSLVRTFFDELNPIPFFDMIYSLGGADNALGLEKNKINFILLIPKLIEDDLSMKGISQKVTISDFSHNKWVPILIYKDGSNKELNGRKIFYKSSGSGFFVSNNQLSETIAESKLCSSEDLQNKITSDYFNKVNDKGEYIHLNEIDLINREVIVNLKVDDSISCNERFSWMRGKAICKQNNLEIKCETLLTDFKYDESIDIFFKQVMDFYKNNNKCVGLSYNLKFRDLTLKEIQDNKYDLKFEEVFQLYVNDKNEAVDISKLPISEKEKWVLDFAKWIGINNYNFNNVETAYSNEAGLVGSKFYFFVKKDNFGSKYYSFNQFYLRKLNINGEEKIYLNGEEVKIISDSIEGDLPGLSFLNGDNKKILWIKVNVENNFYDVLLSPLQYYSIEVLRN